jgi:hypothetical protein
MPDIRLSNHGTIVLLHGDTPAGHHWLVEHTPEDAQWFGDAVVAEPRYVGPIIEGALGDGLNVG